MGSFFASSLPFLALVLLLLTYETSGEDVIYWQGFRMPVDTMVHSEENQPRTTIAQCTNEAHGQYTGVQVFTARTNGFSILAQSMSCGVVQWPGQKGMRQSRTLWHGTRELCPVQLRYMFVVHHTETGSTSLRASTTKAFQFSSGKAGTSIEDRTDSGITISTLEARTRLEVLTTNEANP